ncbi:MAG: 16S rRNA (cytosine(967)-C(5))-methyltransferase RsmB [Gallionellaceae bacterium]|nr:16S rRNA (cytosine(967)-C(5))-methyltransferase RsmB [Gallionellaceae bacterium]
MQTIHLHAVSIIGQVLAGKNLNQALDAILKKQTILNPQERGALQDLCYGTLRFYGQLSSMLSALLLKPLSDNNLRNLLLIALYQLHYSKAAKYAVVDHTVETSKQINRSAGGLVNAVLRNFLRRQEELTQLAARSEEGRYSYPQWWIDKTKAQYGERAADILFAGNQHPPMTLRVNKHLVTPQQYLVDLASQGIAAQLITPEAVLLETPLPVEKIPGFALGKVSVQDAGAQYAANLLDIFDGMRVLDVCAAPGGKSAHLLERAKIELTAVDIDEQRLFRVTENLQRLKLGATLLCGDAAQPNNWWDGKPFERILADVPCSASGVVRRHPDIKWLRRPSDIAGFAQQQAKILDALWPLLAEGGKLLYATCSIFVEENQQNIEQFLLRQKNAKQIPVVAEDLLEGQLLPNEQHDGFFYALLQKTSS